MLAIVTLLVITASPRATDFAGYPSYEGWSRAQIEADWLRDHGPRPGLAPPIILIAVSGGGAIWDLIAAAVGGVVAASGGFTVGTLFALAVVAVLGITAVAMVVTGIILLYRVAAERRAIDARFEDYLKLQDGLTLARF